MNVQAPSKGQVILLAGDILILALVTIYGFASHGTLGSAGERMLTTFLPLVVSWLLIAPHLGVFDAGGALDPRRLWRPFWAMVLAGPMAAFLRGAWLSAPIMPLFVVILGGVSALGLLAWRCIYLLAGRRWKR